MTLRSFPAFYRDEVLTAERLNASFNVVLDAVNRRINPPIIFMEGAATPVATITTKEQVAKTVYETVDKKVDVTAVLDAVKKGTSFGLGGSPYPGLTHRKYYGYATAVSEGTQGVLVFIPHLGLADFLKNLQPNLQPKSEPTRDDYFSFRPRF